MRLDHATWPEVEAYLARANGVFLPAGSIEQHGPMGLIGTDAICAEVIAGLAADRVNALVAPTLSYAPAPFNMAFPGTVSISADLFQQLAGEVMLALHSHGFQRIYVLNGHGANLEPLAAAAILLPDSCVRLRSWWDFEQVNLLRQSYYGAWEGMHATPSEVAITQAAVRVVTSPDAISPPEKLDAAYIRAHSGDRHGPPDQHRAMFPDGRVGSHSALARPEHGQELIDAATEAVALDFTSFCEA